MKVKPSVQLLQFPPELLVKLLGYLTVESLARISQTSRRLKILANSDEIYIAKINAILGTNVENSTTTDASFSKLADKLKQLPGAEFFSSAAYLKTGTSLPRSRTISAVPTHEEPLLVDIQEEPPKLPQEPPKITSSLTFKKSSIVVGAGGLKASKSKGIVIGASKTPPLPEKTNAKERFRNIYVAIYPYYIDFRLKHTVNDSKALVEFSSDPVHLGALLYKLRRLNLSGMIARDVKKIRTSLESTIDAFESTLLSQFERYYDMSMKNEMKKIALACFNLNGGVSCINLFISKNPIFFDATFNPSLVASKLPSSSEGGYALGDDFASFMDHTLTSCRAQSHIVVYVFPNPVKAITSFIARVFEDSVSEYVVAVINAAKESSDMALYIHTLAICVHCCMQFLEHVGDGVVVVESESIKQSLQKVFLKYTKTYMTEEMNFLAKRVEDELKKWNKRKDAMKKSNKAENTATYLNDADKVQEHKRHVMAVMKAVLFAPIELGRTIGHLGSNLFSRSKVEAVPGEPSDSEKDDNVTYHLDDDSMRSLVSLELCLNLMHLSKESLGRVLVITAAMDYSKLKVNVGKVFIKLLHAIGEGHMNIAFRNAISRMEASKPMAEWTEQSMNVDALQFFELIHIADLVHQMIDAYFAEDIKPWIDESDFLSDVMVEKKSFDRISDDNVAHGMDKAIQVLITQIDSILENDQKPTDYNPIIKGVLDFKPSRACEIVIACLNAHTRLINGVTNKDTWEVFVGEVGVRLFNVICKNLKRQQVSSDGAMQLVCDMNRYHEWAMTLRVASVGKLFLVLKELGLLFLADGGDELRELVHSDRYQGALRPEEIYEILAARTDYRKIQKYVETKECLVM